MMRPSNSVEAAYRRSPKPEMECPPTAPTVEGQGNDWKAAAAHSYPDSPTDSKPFADHYAHARDGTHKSRWEGSGAADGPPPAYVTLRAPDGRMWAYRGKRARVLAMLVQAPHGTTQWDTLPWHTRLGGTIHAMRDDGLAITTQIEGKDRHARYHLKTSGVLTTRDGRQIAFTPQDGGAMAQGGEV